MPKKLTPDLRIEIEIIEALVANNPFRLTSYELGLVVCAYCGKESAITGAAKHDHKRGCLWVQAHRWLTNQKQRQRRRIREQVENSAKETDST